MLSPLPALHSLALYRPPTSARGWLMVILIAILLVAGEALLKRFYPNMTSGIRRLITIAALILLVVIVLCIGGEKAWEWFR